jgi:hypothetical protein
MTRRIPRHVHTYVRDALVRYFGAESVARCSVCGRTDKLENLVYLGDPPPSVGPGTIGWFRG